MGRAVTWSVEKGHPPAVFDARWSSAGEIAETIVENVVSCGLFGASFSLVELMDAITSRLGQVDLDMLTFVSSANTMAGVHAWMRNGSVRNLRLAMDRMVVSAAEMDLAQVQEWFGPDSVRILRQHAKVSVFRPVDGAAPVVLTCSANFNNNPRLEHFFATRDVSVGDFWDHVFDEIWKKCPSGQLVGMDSLAVEAASNDVIGRRGKGIVSSETYAQRLLGGMFP